MPFVDRLTPPLTTIRIQHYEMGAQAARLLLQRLERPEAPGMSIQLGVQLVVRGSTAPPALGGTRQQGRLSHRLLPPWLSRTNLAAEAAQGEAGMLRIWGRTNVEQRAEGDVGGGRARPGP